MNLTAVFESWHIGDGNYPPLNKGQLVNLAFELEPRRTEEARLNVPESFEHLGEGEYHFCGTVVRVYEGDDQDTIFRVQIPEKFVARHGKGKSLPTRLVTGDYTASDVEEVNTMEGQSFDEEFYIIEFDSSGLAGRDIRRTFIS